jgi:glutathione S-transferase
MTAHSAAAPAKATLITFPPSLDCELSRFVLGYYAIPYEEVRHTVLFSFLATLWHGGTLHFPLLYGGGSPTLDTVRKMIDHFDAGCPADRTLLLAGSDHAAVEADWTQFNAVLGGATASYAYFHLLPHRAIMIRPLTEGTPSYEVAAVRAAYPLFAGFLKLALHLSPDNAEKSLGQVRQVVRSVDARLADGRRYLVGGRFSLSDMSFANALGPLVLPPEYGGPLPTFDEMPPELQGVVKEMQSHPAGKFALRIYRDHRRAAPQPAP